jgi:hypothetical protein
MIFHNLGVTGDELGFVACGASVGLKPSARATKPGTQRVPGGLIQATKVAFVMEAEGFSPTAPRWRGKTNPQHLSPNPQLRPPQPKHPDRMLGRATLGQVG